jgi:NDP-sugar pyrophosphorylase family protein
MHAVILAGGKGVRLRPYTTTLPKPLMPIGDKHAILEIVLDQLAGCGFTSVTLAINHLGPLIKAFVGDGSRFGLSIDVAYDGPRLLGTAGALRQARSLLGDAFFVLYGDSYLPCAYAAVQAAFEASRQPALMTVFRNSDRWDRSNVEFADGAICAYSKQAPGPRMRHIDYGLGVLTSAALEPVPSDQPYDLESLYQHLLARGQLAGYEVTQRFYEAGSFAGLAELEAHLALTGSTQGPTVDTGLCTPQPGRQRSREDLRR